MSASPPASRRHVAASPTAVVKAGSLSHELQSHAFERATHFFYFVVTMKMVVHELNRLGGSGTPHLFTKWLSIKATDQIGSGLRSDDSVYTDFVRTDPKVVETAATHFSRSDAAHFCNLGLKPGFDSACHANAFTRDGYERLKVYAGNTMQLPQLINLGPDRKIDVMHGELASHFLDDTAVIFSRDRVKTYRELAVARISDYCAEKTRSGQAGLAECGACYLKAYNDQDFGARVYRQVYPEIIGLCEASAALKGQARLFFS